MTQKYPEKEDGYVAIQKFEDPNHHAIGTRIAECIVPEAMIENLVHKMKMTFDETDAQVETHLHAKTADLFIWIRIPSSSSCRVTDEKLKMFLRVLRGSGFVMNPLICHLRPGKH